MTQSITCYQCRGKGQLLKLGNMGFKECIVCDGRGIVLAEKGYVAPERRAKVIPDKPPEESPKKRKYTKKSESWKNKLNEPAAQD